MYSNIKPVSTAGRVVRPTQRGIVIPSPIYEIKETKKMNFLKRWFSKLSNRDDEEITPVPVQDSIGIDQPERAIRFVVYNANGGRVVETHRYDRKNDRNVQNLYVITNDKEFGNEIDKIITMESLR